MIQNMENYIILVFSYLKTTKYLELETKTLGYRQSFLRQLLGNFGVAGVRKGGPIIGTGRADN